jgi:catechol 2,3-dioxygenase-like lactoylglutathione lyase family enzyme
MNTAIESPRQTGRIPTLGVDHVAYNVPDLEAALTFFTIAFGCEMMSRNGPVDYGSGLSGDRTCLPWRASPIRVGATSASRSPTSTPRWPPCDRSSESPPSHPGRFPTGAGSLGSRHRGD